MNPVAQAAAHAETESEELAPGGLVSRSVVQLIARQVDEHGIVVWYDPERHYSELAGSLSSAATTVAIYEGSFFRLRREVDPLLDGEAPPRLVVYVPVARDATGDALVELEAAGLAVYPGAHPWPRNTRLAVLARRALKDVLGQPAAEAIEKQVEAGRMTLAELDRLAEQGGPGSAVISLIFGSANPGDVALAFLGSEAHDAQLLAKGALPELAALFSGDYGADLGGTGTPLQVRERLARYVLAADSPAGLDPGALPQQAAARAACQALARQWRLRRDLRESYAVQAERVERELGLSGLPLSLEQLRATETFPASEEALQEAVERSLLAAPTAELVALAEERQSSFWADLRPEVQARWALAATAGRLLSEADRVAAALKGGPVTAEELLRGYAEGEGPWCLLDTHHRHLARRYHTFDFDVGGRHGTLEKLVARARQRYMEVGSALAERFVRAYQTAGFQLEGVLPQRQIFCARVGPALEEGKTAYVLVDALRFEMARELAGLLWQRFEVDLRAALGTLPSITEIGMAALLPGAEAAAALRAAGSGKLALEIDGALLKDRKERVEFLRSRAGFTLFDAKLEDLLPLKRAARAGIEEAELVLVTSQEIDALCEGDNVPLARRTMDDILWQLRRALLVLAGLGVQTIVVTADHGYLFAEELESDMKLDPPGGATADLHRRVWVGRGGTASPSYLRATAAAFGLGGDLEIAVPWGFACFKVAGGARAYFHGGLSPQEIVVPVLVLRPKAAGPAAAPAAIAWQLAPGSKKVTTRFFSVQIAGQVTGLFEASPPRVRVEMRSRTRVLSRPVSSSYGFDEATGDVELRLKKGAEREIDANTVTLMLEEGILPATVSVHLMDIGTGRDLATLGRIEVGIAL